MESLSILNLFCAEFFAKLWARRDVSRWLAALQLSSGLSPRDQDSCRPKLIAPSEAPAPQYVGDCEVDRLGVCQVALVLRL